MIALRVCSVLGAMLLVVWFWSYHMADIVGISDWVRSSEEIKARLGDVKNVRVIKITYYNCSASNDHNSRNRYLVEVSGEKERALVSIEEGLGNRGFRLARLQGRKVDE